MQYITCRLQTGTLYIWEPWPPNPVNHHGMHAGFGDNIGPTSSQVPRLWVSPRGAVSPLHFDASSSFLIQLQGRKRMLFWPPSDLPGLYPYHNLHLLRRRARVDPINPDFKRFPRFRWLAPLFALASISQEFAISLPHPVVVMIGFCRPGLHVVHAL